MRLRPCRWLVAFVVLLLLGSLSPAEDWPTWRYDARRSASSPRPLPEPLHLQWLRHLPPLKPAYRNPRLQFDASYEPVALGQTLFVGSSHNDAVMAFDTATGAERWRFYCDGPVRVAPVAWEDRVFVGSDDGCLYCLAAVDGRLLWKLRAVPSPRKLLGNGRLISVWPVRGGPVLADGHLCFAAGVLPMEGVFLYAVDAKSGQVVWRNDRTGYLYGIQPHGAESLSGLTPQGYLVVDGEDLIVPCGTAVPARVDRRTGTLKSFALPKDGRVPGGWFTAAGQAQRRGDGAATESKLVFDGDVNRDRHEGGWNVGAKETGARSQIVVGARTWAFKDGFPGVEGTVHGMLAADDRLFIVTREGALYCFGAEPVSAKTYSVESQPLEEGADAGTARAETILQAVERRAGFALVWGLGTGRLIEELVRRTDFQIIAVDPDEARVHKVRQRLDEAGLYGTRVAVHVGTPHRFGFPPYLADLIVSDDLAAAGWGQPDFNANLFHALRPYGGGACLELPADAQDPFARGIREASLPGAEVRRAGALTLLTRTGALPGASNYLGGWSNPDACVGAPLGTLWFDDSIGRFKRAPQPKYVNGVMISHDKDWLGWPDGVRPPYRLKGTSYMDMYTGRVLSREEAETRLGGLPDEDLNQKQPEQYRPPTQKDPWSPPPPVIGERINPLTGQPEPRAFPKSYGCDGGVDYGYVYTMRSGTAAFYDKRLESGTIHISGPRSGCTNSVIPACGLLNVPYFYEGCTCSYPLPVGLAMVRMPETYEQWTVWGASEPKDIQRLGINLGAPGDRTTEGGTLWLDWPSVGGPSPQIAVRVEPETTEYFYRHSLWIEGGQGWPWVVASGAKGITGLHVAGLKPGRFTVRLSFAEPDPIRVGERVFDVAVQGQPVVRGLDIVARAGGPQRGLVEQCDDVASDGTLAIAFSPRSGTPILCGVELIAAGLPPGPIVR